MNMCKTCPRLHHRQPMNWCLNETVVNCGIQKQCLNECALSFSSVYWLRAFFRCRTHLSVA